MLLRLVQLLMKLGPPGGAALAWLPALVVAVPATWLSTHGGRGEKFGVVALEVGGFIALASLSFLSVWVWHRWIRAGAVWNFATLFCMLLVLSWLRLSDDLSAASERLAGDALPSLVLTLFVVGGAALVTVLGVASRFSSRTRFWPAVPCLGLSIVLVNAWMLEADYPGVHLFAVLASVVVVGAFLFSFSSAARLRSPRASSRRGQAAPVVAGAIGVIAMALVAKAPASTRSAWLQASMPPIHVLTGGLSVLAESDTSSAGVLDQWYTKQDSNGQRAPIELSAAPKVPVVVLITIDALRADVAHGEHDVNLPTLTRLRNEAIVFSQARAAATLTKVSVAATFMSKYFSEQYWAKSRKGYVTPQEDPSPRFTDLLRAAGLRTVSFRTIGWLRNGNGHVRGFDEDTFVKKPAGRGGGYTPSGPAVDAIVKRLDQVREEPLFLHTHLTDPHAPYTIGGRRGDAFERYLGEVVHVDQQLSRLLRFIEQSPLATRTVLILTADHGEAFGEHGAKTHGTTLYDEELRVPLFVRIPGVRHRRIDRLVSTIDIAPTVLDLFAQPTPHSYTGRSLLGCIVDDGCNEGRPVAAEGRLRQALVFPDQLKIIYDTRSRHTELYDLAADPGERENIVDRDPTSGRALARLKSFFRAHRLAKEGYSAPYIR